jgi:alginate O-acetyltransferase complex protein AlgJ
MTIILRAAHLAVPTLFFGYGIFANLALLTGPQIVVDLPEDGLLSGGLTRDLDHLYKKDLPHMGLSFGLIGAARYALLGEARQGAVVGQDGWLFSGEEVRPVPDDTALAGIVQTVLGVRAQLLLAGTDLVVVPLPAKIDIYRDIGPDSSFGAALEGLYAGFSGQLSGVGVAVVDARTPLLDPAEAVFFATDTHWTPLGASLVAAAVAASGTVATGPITYDRATGTATWLTGDLVSFVTTPDLAPRIGLPPETVTPFVQTPAGAASDIFGATGTDIVLVGTSYSANPDWGFADALMAALGRDVVSVAEQGLGPLQPMQDFLVSADFRDAPPAVVIWEIPIRYLTDPAIWPDATAPEPQIAALTTQANSDG